MRRRLVLLVAATMWLSTAWWAAPHAASQVAGSPQTVIPAGAGQDAAAMHRVVLNQYCVTCHNERLKTGGLVLDKANLADVAADPEIWERVVRKLRTGTMPPQGVRRPDRATYDALSGWLEAALDHAAAAGPNPGRPLLHRVNRVEYGNVIRDLLALDVDAASLLPPDDAGFGGFDNIADVLGVSPMLQERYLSAAGKIAALALGGPELSAPVDTKYPVPADRTQMKHIDGLPLGTRGGVLIRHTFAVDGEYLIAPKLWKTNNWVIRGIMRPNQLEITLDGERIHLATIGGPNEPLTYGSDDDVANGIAQDASPEDVNNKIFERLQVRVPVKAGPHAVGVAFVYQSAGQEPQLLQPLESRIDAVDAAGVAQIDFVLISGPFHAARAGDTPSRRKLLVCRPTSGADERACATRILSTVARRAYRRPVTEADLQSLVRFFDVGRKQGGDFDTGIQVALQRLLTDPSFIFRAEHDPATDPAGSVHRISDLELASRLSFFLWSSIPDDELLDLAIKNRLRDPATLERQVRRMLGDARSRSLVSNFAGQWLYVRNLKGTNPDRMEFADFDDNLRMAFQRETEMFFESVMREDRSVVDLMTADYTFVDERLARHYGIPNVYGSRFRRVTVTDEARKGLLGKGSVLAVTSRADRTSPVLRGKWILENILGSPPPPPPPVVPPFPENNGEEPRTVRERLEQHRANPACAGCHRLMDPLGLALENFDAIGGWRTRDAGHPIEPSGEIFDGTKVDGVVALRQALLSRPENFVETLTEKLLTYGLGRALVYSDMPVIRAIVRDSSRDRFRFSSIVLGIVKSTPFNSEASRPRQPSWPRAAAPRSSCDNRSVHQGVAVMFITKMSLPRRTFLRGMGATVALPLLEAMVPAFATRAATAPVRRFAGIYTPHGCVMDRFTPQQSGAAFEFTQILKPLQPLRESVVVVTGVNGPASVDGGGHALAPASWLTGTTAKKTQGADIHAGISIDQVIAKQIGRDTVFPSLELATEDFSDTVGSCEIGFSCAYMNTISWSSPTTPVPMELNPRVVFERLFGGTGTPEQRLVQMQRNSTILDDVRGETVRLQRALGAQDRARLTDFLDNIREIERRIQRAEQQAGQKVDTPAAPSGIPDSFAEHVSLQFELLAMAFRTDLTRVGSFMNGRDVTYHNYPELGFTDGHHPLSHHANNPEKMTKFAKVNTYEVSLFAKFLEKLRSTPDGDGSLLDHTAILYGSGMSHGNLHSHTGLPVIVAGGGAGQIHGGRHLMHEVSATNGIPNGNVLLSLGRMFGCELNSFGQSNGTIDL